MQGTCEAEAKARTAGDRILGEEVKQQAQSRNTDSSWGSILDNIVKLVSHRNSVVGAWNQPVVLQSLLLSWCHLQTGDRGPGETLV